MTSPTTMGCFECKADESYCSPHLILLKECYVYNDVEEPYPLSPADFLVGRRLIALPPCDFNINAELISDQMKNHWRKREHFRAL
ncbi:hypothetical protein HPB50_011296 [Hyalomma asiaticum]|uniref:Uncharacterized protein n=1 Tax=Hyalomma asiaticum TaxID=266040 RepID=A0ACB7SL23_HYAAI|nr:hypothetical protein HPB50_011296 [Hyalomma asiaticum]